MAKGKPDKQAPQDGKLFKSGSFGGKKQEDIKSMGHSRALLAAQKRGKNG